MIWASSEADTGISWDSFKMSLDISLNCCGVSKSTTLRTSAMTDSNSMADWIGPAKNLVVAPQAIILPM